MSSPLRSIRTNLPRLEKECQRLAGMPCGICWQGHDVGVRCSVGICRIAGKGIAYARVYQEADRALYSAKRGGKSRCCTCELRGDM